MKVTGERFMPDYPGDWSPEHYHRYFLARELVEGKRVLDIASGECYGSAILAQLAKHVTGVDISQKAVDAARDKYKKDNLDYVCRQLRNHRAPYGTNGNAGRNSAGSDSRRHSCHLFS